MVDAAAVNGDPGQQSAANGVSSDPPYVATPIIQDDAAAGASQAGPSGTATLSPPQEKKTARWVLSDEAKRVMESVYQQNKFPTLATRERLSVRGEAQHAAIAPSAQRRSAHAGRAARDRL